MNSRNMILSGALLAVLVAMLTFSSAPIALAGGTTTGAGTTPDLQVYLLKKAFAICENEYGVISHTDPFNLNQSNGIQGTQGNVPASGQQFGCIEAFGDRFNQYLFTGEQMAVLVAVRDVQGAAAIGSPVQLALDSVDKSICTDITSAEPQLASGTYKWYGHDVSVDLSQQPGQDGSVAAGFNPAYDKLYSCLYQATDADSGPTQVTIDVMDIFGATPSFNNALDQVWFNPEILVDVTTSDGNPISFAPGSAGQTVYSTNTLMVTNEASGGVVLVGWLAGTDLTSSTGAGLCPTGNALSISNMEYRCKIGTLFNNPWNTVPSPNDLEKCEHVGSDCQQAEELLPDVGYGYTSFLTVGSTAECWFRLHYPIPCIGSFDEGSLLIYVRAI